MTMGVLSWSYWDKSFLHGGIFRRKRKSRNIWKFVLQYPVPWGFIKRSNTYCSIWFPKSQKVLSEPSYIPCLPGHSVKFIVRIKLWTTQTRLIHLFQNYIQKVSQKHLILLTLLLSSTCFSSYHWAKHLHKWKRSHKCCKEFFLRRKMTVGYYKREVKRSHPDHEQMVTLCPLELLPMSRDRNFFHTSKGLGGFLMVCTISAETWLVLK